MSDIIISQDREERIRPKSAGNYMIDKLWTICGNIPKYFIIYTGVLFTWLLFAALYFPVTDSDALASYVARFEYARFGLIESVATLSLQYTFPKTFDWLVWIVSSTGYLAGVPAFICFLSILFIITRSASSRNLTWVLILVLSSPLIIAQAVSQKNDIALAAGFVVSLTALRLYTGPLVLPTLLLICAFLIGTKWLGVPIAMLIMLAYFVSVALGRQKLAASSLVISGLLIPVYFIVSSMQSYVQNIIKYGSAMPILADMRPAVPTTAFVSPISALNSIFNACYASIVDVLKLPIIYFNKLFGFNFFDSIDIFHAYLFRDLFITSHAPIGYAFPLMLTGCIIGLIALPDFRNKYGIQVTSALGVMFIIASKLDVSGGHDRYLMPVYVALIEPTSTLFSACISRKNKIKHFLVLLSIYISACTVIFSADRTPLPVAKTKYPFYRYMDDHDQLMFMGAPGYIPFYSSFIHLVERNDGLLILDNSNQDDINANNQPYFLPFIINRSPANTKLVRLLNNKVPEDANKYRFILVYSMRAKSLEFQNYHKVLSTYFPALILYKRYDVVMNNTKND